MFNFFKNKNDGKRDDGIVILKQTRPNECGGTDATQDTKAPTNIKSDEMTLFDATSALGQNMLSNADGDPFSDLCYLSAFAAPVENGTFMFLETASSRRRRGDIQTSWALVKENVFPSLVKLVNECDLAKNNGYHSTTHGLPENFGGSVYISYASGEKISFSNNQAPVLRIETAKKIAKLFDSLMNGEKVLLPSVDDIKAIKFLENRKDGGYTKATLTINEYGSAVNEKSMRFDDPKVYESTKNVSVETVDAIKKYIVNNGVLANAGLPSQKFSSSSEKSLTFIFKDGKEIFVKGGCVLPNQIRNGFFNIELEMTTKH